MKVMLLMVAKKPMEQAAPPTEEALRAMHEFTQELQRTGVLVDLGGLTPPSRGKRVRFGKSKRTVIDGPFAEAKETIGGYMIVEVKSLDEAIDLVKRAPFSGDDDEAEVEIRPLFDPSEFDVPGEAEERAKQQGQAPGKA